MVLLNFRKVKPCFHRLTKTRERPLERGSILILDGLGENGESNTKAVWSYHETIVNRYNLKSFDHFLSFFLVINRLPPISCKERLLLFEFFIH